MQIKIEIKYYKYKIMFNKIKEIKISFNQLLLIKMDRTYSK